MEWAQIIGGVGGRGRMRNGLGRSTEGLRRVGGERRDTRRLFNRAKGKRLMRLGCGF